ncbi:MAG: hypothetical protein WD716_05300 [Fimbriimonadaceae bacterium]
MKALWLWLAIGGLVFAGYFCLFYDLGALMEMGVRSEQRKVAVEFGVGTAIVGALLYGFSQKPG